MENQKQEQPKKSFFGFAKKASESAATKPEPIKIEFQVEKCELSLDSIKDYANSRLESEDNVMEVVVADSDASSILDTVTKKVTVNLGEGVCIVYLMDVIERRISRIVYLCVDSLSESLQAELSANNHIIRLTK